MLVTLLVFSIQAAFAQDAYQNVPFLKDYATVDFQIEPLSAAHPLKAATRQKSLTIDNQPKNDATVLVKFTAYNRVFELELSPNKLDIFAPDASLGVHGAGQVPLKTQHLYSGHVVGDPASEVFGWILNDVFQGSVKLSTGDLYHIESSLKYSGLNGSQAIVYRDTDLHRTSRLRSKLGSAFHPIRCGTKTKFFPQGSNATHRRQKRDSTITRKTCLMYFKVDIFYWNLVFNAEGQQNTDLTTSQITGIVAQLVYAINAIYTPTQLGSSGSGYNMKVLKIEIDTPQSCLNSRNPLCIEPNVTSSFSLHFHSCANFNSYCIAFLLTDHVYEESTIGLAYTPDNSDRTVGICSRYSSDNVLIFKNYVSDPYNADVTDYGTTWLDYVDFQCTQQSRNTGLVTTRSEDGLLSRREHELTLAHEIGHTFGAQHDPDTVGDTCTPSNANGGKYIMAPYVSSGSLVNNAHFSSCSINDIDTNLISLRQNQNTDRYYCLVASNDTTIPNSSYTFDLAPSTTPSTDKLMLYIEIVLPICGVVLGVIIALIIVCCCKKPPRTIAPVQSEEQ